MLLLAVTFLMFLLGVGLLAIGRRGRTVGDHPHCRRCGFDLFAKSAESTRCPECGASLNTSKATRVGHREPRRALVWLGILLIFPSLFAAATLLVALSQGPRAAAWKPGPWLALEVASNNADLRQAAIAELSRRIVDHKLSRWSVQLMASQILASQADPHRPWDRKGWGGLIEQTHDEDLLRAADWARFAQQSIELELKLRPCVAPGEPLTFKISAGKGRIGSTQWFAINGPVHITVGGRRYVPNKPFPVINEICDGLCTTSTTFHLAAAATAGLPPGEHDFSFQMDGQVTPKEDIVASHDQAKPLAPCKIELHARFTLLGPGESSVTPDDDPNLVKRVKQSAYLQLEDLAIDSNGATLTARFSDAMSEPWGQQSPALTPVAYSVYLRTSGREWLVDRFAQNRFPSTSTTWKIANLKPNRQEPLKVDVILRPDREIAAATLDVTNYANTELLFENMTVKWKPAP